MTRIVTSKLGEDYGERHELLKAVDFERRANIGCVMNDGHGAPRSRENAEVRRVTFPPIFARAIRNVELSSDFVIRRNDSLFADASIFSVNARTQGDVDNAVRSILQQEQEFVVTESNTVAISAPVLITSNEGSGTWGHWMIHNLPRIALAKAAFPDLLVMVPASYFGSSYGNYGAMLDQLEIPREHCIPTRPKVLYKLDTAVMVDYLYGIAKIHPFCMDVYDLMAEKWQPDADAPRRRMAIRRTTDDKREATNAGEFETLLSEAGFEHVTLGAKPVSEQIAAWAGAQNVCSVLGSDLANIVFGQPDSNVLAVTPAWFGDDFFFDLAAARGLTWNELFCGKMELERKPIINSSFRIDVKATKEFLEKAVKE